MLVLTRKLGEKVNIGDNVSVTVVQIKGKQVRLGFTAPQDTRIDRSEILDKIKDSEESVDKTENSDII